MRQFTTILAVGSACIAFLDGWGGGAAQADITARLKKGGSEPVAAAATPPRSQITLVVNLPFSKLEAILNKFTFKVQSRGAIVGVTYNAVVTVDHVSVVQSENTDYPLRVIAPFHVGGRLAGSNLDETGTARIDFRVPLGEIAAEGSKKPWCPILEFDDPWVEMARPVPAPAAFGFPTISELVGKYVLRQQLETQLTCAGLKGYIADLWHDFDLPLHIAGNTLFLSVSPRSLAVTDVRAVDDHIIFKAVISTAAVMTPTASKGKQNKLPEMLGRITPFPTPSAIEIDGGISGAIGVGTH